MTTPDQIVANLARHLTLVRVSERLLGAMRLLALVGEELDRVAKLDGELPLETANVHLANLWQTMTEVTLGAAELAAGGGDPAAGDAAQEAARLSNVIPFPQEDR